MVMSFTALHRIALVAGALWAGAAFPLWAAEVQWRPDRPVRFVLPFAPGGAADVVARVLAPQLQELTGQPWVVDNRGGAGGTIAAEIVARANPDGHTVFLGISTAITVSPLLMKLPIDVTMDLAPVAMATAAQYMLVLHPSVAAGNLKDFVALAKSKPGVLNYASTGVGGPSFMSMALFSHRSGIRMTAIPYKGGGPAANAMLGGEVQAMFLSIVAALPHVKAGRLKALAVSGPQRATVAPDIATVAELGYPGFSATTWYGLLLPGKSPGRIAAALDAAAAKALAVPDVVEVITRQGAEVSYKGRKEFAAHIRQETGMWAQVIKEAGIKGE